MKIDCCLLLGPLWTFLFFLGKIVELCITSSQIIVIDLTRFVEPCIMSSQIVDVSIWGYYLKLLENGYWHPKDATEELNGLLAEG
ncbi:hypothetical protein BW895_28535 [Bacillus cereus]|uniref:Uncharacterized protein n=4 Tax=Bacteria TaxID=2 RepID=A0A9X6KI89_BACTU|nr:hypothetical protein BT4G5_34435 [Bacillus thuringiensis serovar galleriae]ETE88968.1 hypothetical protein C623_0232810 [Bacillus thuringiensis serovar aizawai str. Hu4-2]ETE96100.1 hypothetical protein C621_0200535 [Bacillus thuringiensis serovar aizawai str. Leapi01]ETT86050.1 hypothetical protein C175_04018 [Bacillus cereus]MDX7993468.1 hypothetical protein [Xenorhabdus sp. psl]OIX15429.1 hypothetical protein BMT18_28525 [Bacillus thuringiensis serovar aizawai]OUA13142.1 hypothetical pr